MKTASKLKLPSRWFVVYAPDPDGEWRAKTAGGSPAQIAAQAKGIAVKHGKCAVVSVRYKKLRIVRGGSPAAIDKRKLDAAARKFKAVGRKHAGLTPATNPGTINPGV